MPTSAPAPILTQIVRALVIGINDYEPDPRTGAEIDLNGCVWDAREVQEKLLIPAMRRAAKRYPTDSRRHNRRLARTRRKLRSGHARTCAKYGAPDITMMLDRAATADEVLAELGGLCSQLAPGETGLFYRSGHGTQIVGAEAEADNRDEAFCCADALSGGYLIDDAIAEVIAETLHPEAHLIIIADNCHAGDSHRSLASSTLERARGTKLVPYDESRHYVFSGELPRNVTAWYACATDEVAWERNYDGKVRGAFTRTIAEYLPMLTEGTLDIDAAHVDVCRHLDTAANDKGGQMPQLERWKDA